MGLSKVFNILRIGHKLSFISLKVLPIRSLKSFVLLHKSNILFCSYLRLRLVLANFLFFCETSTSTLGLLPLRRHVVWRDSVGGESSGSGSRA